MADDVDVRELREGNSDLARRDFRKADLAGLDLQERNFTKAHLEGAKLSGANLSRSILNQILSLRMNLQDANLSDVTAKSTVFHSVNMKGANLRRADFSHSHFTRCDLTGADLSGANFENAVINEESSFENCIVDENTKFDGVSIFRPLARQDAFRYYRVERGFLIRKEDGPSSPAQAEVSGPSNDIVAKIDVFLRDFAKLAPDSVPVVQSVGMGHNNPPEETPIDFPEYTEIVDSLQIVREEISVNLPKKVSIDSAIRLLVSSGAKILMWGARKLDVAAEEFAKEAGKSLGSKPGLVASWLAVTGNMDSLVLALTSYSALLLT